MDIRTPLRLLLVTGLGGLMVMMAIVTGHLQRLKAGIDQNLLVAQSLPRVQAAVMERNQRLGEMVSRSEAISQALAGVANHSTAIQQSVRQLDEANRSILQVNQQADAENKAVVAQLVAVRDSLRAMRGAVTAVQGELRGLAGTVKADQDVLLSVQINTGRMEARTPGN
jgi:hypothetical protein